MCLLEGAIFSGSLSGRCDITALKNASILFSKIYGYLLCIHSTVTCDLATIVAARLAVHQSRFADGKDYRFHNI